MKYILTLLLFVIFLQSNTIITDKNTELMWESKPIRTVNKMYEWEESIAYCKNLTLANKYDWRLPTLSELLNIAKIKNINDVVKKGFNQLSIISYYWSSTQHEIDKSIYFLVRFDIGSIVSMHKMRTSSVRCVRRVLTH